MFADVNTVRQLIRKGLIKAAFGNSAGRRCMPNCAIAWNTFVISEPCLRLISASVQRDLESSTVSGRCCEWPQTTPATTQVSQKKLDTKAMQETAAANLFMTVANLVLMSDMDQFRSYALAERKPQTPP
eukprot:gnl/TRDRNA2_/TRDRNA2_166571_c1_seq1.p1 gnl/TRDRNA2_/TRDRNA2_166571_c1~~gnl/TRDRNA2_/TRDRNA2_166571_c1_seq1.p1  ORF type:complete len:129 (-),score=11.52 gnl/TRDRNA2_/TRDRNA2_166571_c1_seq1:75-461(-)